MLTRNVDNRNYDVQVMTGYPVANFSEGQWKRGMIERIQPPEFVPNPRYLRMYDPTDPRTWQNL